MSNSVELVGISHAFQSKFVLNDINLHTQNGEIMGLLGPSGAGKTTLINIVTGQLSATKGRIYINGFETDSHRRNSSDFGIMMDNWGVYDRLSVYDNLKFYADIFRVDTARIEELLSETGLQEARKCLAANLSKGMRSRLNLCRALLKDAKILFLDEPTSGLDPSTTREIHKLIRKQQNNGITIFLTTHNMAEAEALCNHVALLDQGQIIEYGSPSEICKKYNHLNRLVIQRKNGEIITLENQRQSKEILIKLLENEDIDSIHSTEPNLEKVFLELTGRELE